MNEWSESFPEHSVRPWLTQAGSPRLTVGEAQGYLINQSTLRPAPSRSLPTMYSHLGGAGVCRGSASCSLGCSAPTLGVLRLPLPLPRATAAENLFGGGGKVVSAGRSKFQGRAMGPCLAWMSPHPGGPEILTRTQRNFAKWEVGMMGTGRTGVWAEASSL